MPRNRLTIFEAAPDLSTSTKSVVDLDGGSLYPGDTLRYSLRLQTTDGPLDDVQFIDDLGADSLDIVELVMAFEEEFGVEIPDESAEKIGTVKDAVQFLKENIDT